MSEGDPLYNAAHLGLEQWNDIPDSSRINYSHNYDQSDKEQESAYSKVISFLINFMAQHLEALAEQLLTATGRNYYLTVAQELRNNPK